jgi:hypothetical protein
MDDEQVAARATYELLTHLTQNVPTLAPDAHLPRTQVPGSAGEVSLKEPC